MKEKPGALLKKTREARGLTQDDVVKRLRLKLKIIQDIENDYYDNISATVYMRGYLRAYARYLGLKEDEVLQAFSELHIVEPLKSMQDARIISSPHHHHEEVAENPLPWLRWSLFGLLGFLIIAALLVGWNQTKSSKKIASTPVKPLPQTAVIIPTNPEPAPAPINSVAVSNVPAKNETVANTANTNSSEMNAAELNAPVDTIAAEKPYKKAVHRHPPHRIAHKALQPNYTLRPATETETH